MDAFGFPTGFYLLNEDGTTRQAESIEDGMKAMETTEKRVALHEFADGAQLSTVFLFMDHGYNGEVLLFESLFFDGLCDGSMTRYRTMEQAKAGHQELLDVYQQAMRWIGRASYRRVKLRHALSRDKHRQYVKLLRKHKGECAYVEKERLEIR